MNVLEKTWHMDKLKAAVVLIHSSLSLNVFICSISHVLKTGTFHEEHCIITFSKTNVVIL